MGQSSTVGQLSLVVLAKRLIQFPLAVRLARLADVVPGSVGQSTWGSAKPTLMVAAHVVAHVESRTTIAADAEVAHRIKTAGLTDCLVRSVAQSSLSAELVSVPSSFKFLD